MASPKVAHRPFGDVEEARVVVLVGRPAPMRRSATRGARRHMPYMNAAAATTSATTPDDVQRHRQQREQEQCWDRSGIGAQTKGATPVGCHLLRVHLRCAQSVLGVERLRGR